MAMVLSFFLSMQVRARLEEDRGACPHQDHRTGNNRNILIPRIPDRMGVHVSVCGYFHLWGPTSTASTGRLNRRWQRRDDVCRACRYGATRRSTSSRSRSSAWPPGCRRRTRAAGSPWSCRARRPGAAWPPCRCCTWSPTARRSPSQVRPAPLLTAASVGTAPEVSLQLQAAAVVASPCQFSIGTVPFRQWLSEW